MRFFEVLHRVIGLLVCERRVTYQALKLEFGLDEAFLEGIRAELIFAKRVARDEHGTVLVWTGGASLTEPSAAVASPYATLDTDERLSAALSPLPRGAEEAPDVKLAQLERVLQPSTLPLAEVVPLLAALLAIAIPEGRYPALDPSPQQQRQHTLAALQAWLLAEADRQPLLVLWEDLHWADPTTLELLGRVAEQTPTAALLHVLTFRPEFVLPSPTRSHG